MSLSRSPRPVPAQPPIGSVSLVKTFPEPPLSHPYMAVSSLRSRQLAALCLQGKKQLGDMVAAMRKNHWYYLETVR